MDDENKKLKVTQSNALIEASYSLSIDEKRLLMLCVSKIDSRQTVPDKISIDAQEFAATFNLGIESVYKQLKQAKDNLYERDIRMKNGDTSERLRWVHRVSYHKSQGRVSLYFSPDIKPYLGQISRKYSAYYLENTANLKSFYAIRLYELIMQYMDYGTRWLTIESLRETFQLQDKYTKYADLRKYVIETSLKEINLKTDLDVTVKPEREGRKVVKLWFYFTEKKQSRFDF